MVICWENMPLLHTNNRRWESARIVDVYGAGLKVLILLMPQLFFGQCRAKILVVLEIFLVFGFQNLVLIFMVLRGPNTNITGVIFVIDVIEVANEFFELAVS